MTTASDPATQDVVDDQPAPRQRRKERAMTKADWERVHNANVRAKRDPDPAQINILDVVGGEG